MKEQHISFVITDEEKRMLEDVVVFEPFLQDNLGRMKRKGGDKYIVFDAYDLFQKQYLDACIEDTASLE